MLVSLALALAIPPATIATSDASVPTISDALAVSHDDPADYSWDTSAETEVTLSGSGDVTIDEAGAYRLSGTLSDGSVVVDSAGDGTVWLILDGVDISSSTGAAIAVLDAGKTVVWLAEGSVNQLSDAADYVFPDTSTDEPNAALYSADDMTIAGSGSLTVSANYNDGITSKDGLVIADGTIDVTAADDGIRGKDYLVISGGTFDITSDGDGLTSDNEEDAGLGYISISGGTFDIASGADAIEAVTDVLVSGGELTLAADDDGIHSEAWLEISGGTIDVTRSYEGLEGTQIVVSGGAIDVVADDDGLNVAGGDSAAAAEGGNRRGGGRGGETAVEGWFVDISDGTLVIDAGGDGLDSNGSALVTGGTIVVNGPTGQGNGAIDVNGEMLVSGGTLLAAGSRGMAETPSAASEQAVLALEFGSVVPAGTVVRVEAADGTAVATYEAPKQFQTLVLSTPEVVAGQAYEVLLDGTVSGARLGGLYLDPEYSGGISAGTLAAY